MQLQVCVNGHSRRLDSHRAVEWEAGEERGCANFCEIQDGEVTMKVELLSIGPQWQLPDDQYQLGCVLGTGAYGSVREGRDIKADRDVAVKRLELSAMDRED